MLRRMTVEPVFVTLLLSAVLLVGAHDASAKGCLKGAAVGAVAGHVAGHHGVVGAVAGCAVGHHLAKKHQRQQEELQQQQSAKPAPQPVAPDGQTAT